MKKKKVVIFFICFVAMIAIAISAFIFIKSNAHISLDERLTVFIDGEIASHHQTERSKDFYCCLDWEVLGTKKQGNETTIYMWVLYEEFSNDNGLMVESGVHIPTVITVENNQGSYSLVEYWEPRDGSYYEEDIKEKFPMYLWDRAMDSQRYIVEQSSVLEQMAEEHFNTSNSNNAGNTDNDLLQLMVPSEPPQLTMSYNGESNVVWMGGHSWIYQNEAGTFDAIIADSNHPLNCVDAMTQITLIPTTISAIEPHKVNLEFELSPHKITIFRYEIGAENESEGVEVRLDDSTLQLEYGNYLYHIIAEWNYPDKLGGTIDYAFCTTIPMIEEISGSE